MTQTDRFDGRILGVGTTSGVRIVVGQWFASPLGAFTDVMMEDAEGRRTLLAPDERVAQYVGETYHFDDVRVVSVRSDTPNGGRFAVTAGPLQLEAVIGARHPWGMALRAVPQALHGPVLAWVMNPVASLVMPGVQTYGSAKNGRVEAYVAHDLHRVAAISATWAGRSLGQLADVDPAPRFGFSGSPRMPSLTRVTTFVQRR